MYETLPDTLWHVTVFNDDVNLANFVVFVLMHELNLSRQDAEYATRQIDAHGSQTVFLGDEDTCQRIVRTLHAYGLLAQMSPVSWGEG